MKNTEPRKLTQKEKEEVWKKTISGSQAWMLVNEPYNLLRDKLGIERKYKSKYDFFNSEKFKVISDNAKQAGILYEKIVFDEIFENRKDLTHNEKTYFYSGTNKLFVGKLSATPDILRVDENNVVIGIGDIKCSTQAENNNVLSERYYYQLLHNAFVFGAKEIELFAKGMITRPINNIKFPEITEEKFKEYENLLTSFINAWEAKNETYFDYLVEQKEIEQEKETKTKTLEQVEFLTITHLEKLKEEYKNLEKQIKDIEASFKEKYKENTILENDVFKVLINSTTRTGSIDYSALTAAYNINNEALESFRKEPVSYQTFKIERKKGTDDEQ